MWEWIAVALRAEVFSIGGAGVSVGSVLWFAALVLALFIIAGRIAKWLVVKALRRTRLDPSARQAVGSTFHYATILIGLLVIVQTAGFDLTTFNVVAGTIGVGLGFGLQNIAANLVSGLIILFERPVKIGDRIEVGNVVGDVVEVKARSTTVLTNDNIAIIIPNSKLITENVTNWSYTDQTVRFSIPVGVAYGVDARQVEALLLEVAAADKDVRQAPEPSVRFMAFGDSAILFELRVWSSTLMQRKGQLTSNLNFAIYRTFAEHGIPLPFPQRDLHVKGGIDVRLAGDGSPAAGPGRADRPVADASATAPAGGYEVNRGQ